MHCKKEQIEYIQGQMSKIRNTVEERQSWIEWQTVNKVGKRKSISRDKIKVANQKQRI